MAAAAEEYVSIGNPEEYLEGGGLVDDVDATIVKARFCEFDYNGKAAKPALCLKVDYKPTDGQKAFTEYYSGGDLARFKPSKDGLNLLKVGSATTIKKDSNLGIYLAKAIALNGAIGQGISNPKQGVGVLDGLTAHLSRIPQPDRGGRVGKANATMLVIQSFVTNGKATKSKTNGAAKTTPDEDLTDEATGIILGILAANETGITKTKLSQALFKELDGNDNRREIMAIALDPEFLKGSDQWAFDGKSLTAVE